MLGLFGGRKRARTVAVSLAQLIHMFSYSFKTLGPRGLNGICVDLASELRRRQSAIGGSYGQLFQ